MTILSMLAIEIMILPCPRSRPSWSYNSFALPPTPALGPRIRLPHHNGRMTSMEEWYGALSHRCSRGMIAGETLCERILKTTTAMLQDRGFHTSASVAEMKRNLTASLPTRFTNDAGKECMLFLDREERTGVKTVRMLMEQHPETSLVVIAIDGATPFTRREMAKVEHVHLFHAKELIHNITQHAMVPKHEAVPPDEVAAITRTFCVTDEQWPVIFTTDPVARWFAWPPDTIVRIHRNGLTQDRQVFYRKVVKGSA